MLILPVIIQLLGCSKKNKAEDFEMAIADNDFSTLISMTYDSTLEKKAQVALDNYFHFFSENQVSVNTINQYEKYMDTAVSNMKSHLLSRNKKVLRKTIRHINALLIFEEKVLNTMQFSFPVDSRMQSLRNDLAACRDKWAPSVLSFDINLLILILDGSGE